MSADADGTPTGPIEPAAERGGSSSPPPRGRGPGGGFPASHEPRRIAEASAENPAPAPPSGRGAPSLRPADAITSWLDMLDALLRVPNSERAEIRDELESHLRDRTHELMLAGLDADAAARRATTELGEAAELAGRFHESRSHSKRRHVMTMVGIGMAAGAVVVSVSALLFNTGGPRLQVVAPGAPVAVDGQPAGDGTYKLQLDLQPRMDGEGKLSLVPVLSQVPIISNFFKPGGAQPPAVETQPADGELKLDLSGARHVQSDAVIKLDAFPALVREAVKLELAAPSDPAFRAQAFDEFTPPAREELADVRVTIAAGEMPFRDMLELLAKAAELKLQAHWEKLGEAGFTSDAMVSVKVENAPIETFFRQLNERQRDAGQPQLDWRVADGQFIVSTSEHLLSQEIVLVTFDLSKIAGAPAGEGHDGGGTTAGSADRIEQVVHLITNFVSPEHWVENGGKLGTITVFNSKLFIRAPRRFMPEIEWIINQAASAQPIGDGASAPQPDGGQQAVVVYRVKHAAAGKVLDELRRMESIRAVDFTNFVADERTNSVVGKGTPAEHAAVARAIEAIDQPERQLNEKLRNDLNMQLMVTRHELATLTADRQSAEQQLALEADANAPNARTRRAKLAEIQSQQAVAELRLREIEARLVEVSSLSAGK